MRVKNLVAWSGHEFSYGAGAIIDLDDETAKARIAAGLVEKVPENTPIRDAFNLDNAEDRYRELERENGVLKSQIASLIEERDALKSEVEALTAPKTDKKSAANAA